MSNVFHAPFTVAGTQTGQTSSRIATEWHSRPMDERFLSLQEMIDFKRRDSQGLRSSIVDTHDLEVIGDIDETTPRHGSVMVSYRDGNGEGLRRPTHWSLGQLAQLSGAPAAYLRDLPAPLAADCIQWGLRHNRSREQVKAYAGPAGTHLRAMTGPDYGRIQDLELLEPIQRLVEESGGRWKIPGRLLNWSGDRMTYDPEAPVTLESTSLFASDRDVFVFLVDDRNPIEVGRLPNGEPDLVFKGFYAWNSEVGSKTAGIAGFYLRGVCNNRLLTGIQDFQEIRIRHTKYAPDRFAAEARPALADFARSGARSFVETTQAAKAAEIAHDKDTQLKFLTRRAGMSQRLATAALSRHLSEEGREMRTVWDAAQAITAVARDIPHQEDRVTLERKAGELLAAVA